MSAPAVSRSSSVLALAALFCGAVIAAVVLLVVQARTQADFEEFAMRRGGTLPRYAQVGGFPMHCGPLTEAEGCFDGHASRGARPVVLWIGNSQIHGINQLVDGDRSAPEILHGRLDASGQDVIAFSLPNANPQELLVLFLALAERLPLRQLVLPFVYDDFRESDLRAGMVEALEEPAVAEGLAASAVGRAIRDEQQGQGDGSLAALSGTVQQRTETWLNDWLDEHWSLWKAREKARGSIITGLHGLRNTVFRITPQSKRRMIPARFQRNLDAIMELLAQAQRRKIPVSSYIAPLRSDVQIPYVRSEYEEFKRLCARIAGEHGARFADLGELVPAESWGRKRATTIQDDTELDFMHFQGSGHELLADAVHELVTDPSG